MTREEKLDILEKEYLEDYGHEMAQWQKDYLMRFLEDDPKKENRSAAHHNSLVGKRDS